MSEDSQKTWRKNAPFFYDTLFTQNLIWPSLTVEWLPTRDVPLGSEYSVQKLLVGTHASDGESNFLQIMKAKFPTEAAKKGSQEANIAAIKKDRVTLDIQLNHQGEVNKARLMPQSHNIIATMTPSSEVHVFDFFKHPTRPVNNDVTPQMRLQGHEKEGYGLAWSPLCEGLLLTGAHDGQVCLWDLKAAETQNVNPTKVTLHPDAIEDVAFSHFDENQYFSVSDDKCLRGYDRRIPEPSFSLSEAHSQEIRGVDANAFDPNLIVTCSVDQMVTLWDLRKTSEGPLWILNGHQDEVNQAKFSPLQMNLLASAGTDSKVIVWDMSKIGESQEDPLNMDLPPEVQFVHAGHSDTVSDIAWNPNERLTLASVSESNELHVWQMSYDTYYS